MTKAAVLTLQDFHAIAQVAVKWSYAARLRRFEAVCQDGQVVHIANSDLCKVDARLPVALRDLLSDGDYVFTSLQLADMVRKTLDFWSEEDPLVAFSVSGALYVGDIHKVTKSNNDMVMLEATTWEVRRINKDVSYIESMEVKTVLSLQKRVLADHFPDFELRFAQGEVLGLSAEDLAAHVFSKVEAERLSLPDMGLSA